MTKNKYFIFIAMLTIESIFTIDHKLHLLRVNLYQ